MKARLLYHQKARFREHYLLEMTIHEVGRSKRYPDGVKYGVLMDNHHPKGHHLHLDGEELRYENDDRLIEDFKRFALEHLGVEI